MALPNSNISVAMVKSELGAATNDVGQLCIHPNINKWSKWKPVRHGSVVPITEAQLASVNFGLDIEVFTTLGSITTSGSFLHTLKNSSINWSYLRPRGGNNTPSEPYRLADFRNYDKTAINPVDAMGHYEIYMDMFNSFQIDADEIISPPNAHNVTLADFEYSGTLFRNCYLGVMLFKSSGNEFIINTGSSTLENGGLSVLFEDMGSNTGNWNAAFFISSVPFSNNNPVGSGFFVPIELHKPTVSINAYGVLAYAEALGMWNQENTQINYDIVGINNGGGSVTLTNVTAILVYTVGGQSPEEGVTVLTQNKSNITIPGNDSVTVSENTFNHNRVDDGRMYWIGINTSTGVRYLPVEDYDGI